jgi:hypothetical protein
MLPLKIPRANCPVSDELLIMNNVKQMNVKATVFDFETKTKEKGEN